MRVFGPEPAKHHSPRIRFAVTVGIPQQQQPRPFGDITSISPDRGDAGRDQQPVGEHRVPVDAAVSVGVFQHDDLVIGHLPRFDLRINLAAGDP